MVIFLTLPGLDGLCKGLIVVTRNLLKSFLSIVPFCLFLLVDIYWKYETRPSYETDSCTPSEFLWHQKDSISSWNSAPPSTLASSKVHARCYGELEPTGGVLWLCNLCRPGAPQSPPPCCLCPVVGGTIENLEPVLREDIQKIWDSVPKPQAHKDTPLSEFFNNASCVQFLDFCGRRHPSRSIRL